MVLYWGRRLGRTARPGFSAYTRTQEMNSMTAFLGEEKAKRGRPPGGPGKGTALRIPVEVAERARLVGQFEGKTLGQVLVEHAAESLELAYQSAVEARERYEARTARRVGDAPTELPRKPRGPKGKGGRP